MSQFASSELQSTLQRPEPQFAPLSDEMYEAAVRKNKEEEERWEQSLRTEYKGVRPGADIESDSAFRRDIMKGRERFANERSAMRNELAFNREGEYNKRLDSYYNNKMQYLTSTLQMSQADIQNYAQLAQMDTARLMSQFALNKGEASRFQELFGDLGKMMMQQGTGMGYQGMMNQMFGGGGTAATGGQ